MSSVTRHRSGNDEPQPCLVISAHAGLVWKLAYLPGGRRVVTASRDRTVRVWNLENGRQEGTSMEHESEIYGLSATRDGTNIVSGDEVGRIKVWDVESHELVKEWTHSKNYPRIAISPDDRLIAVGISSVAIYTLEGRLVKHSIEVGGAIWSMCFSPDGKRLACGTLYDIRVYDVDSGTLSVGPLEGHQHWISDVLWSRDGRRLFSASTDETIRCWNSDTGEQIGHPWTGHTDNILSLALSPDGSILASASRDKTVRFWDATTGHPIGQQHLQHDEQVDVVRFSPSGEAVASVGWNGTIYLWRVPWLNSSNDWVSTPIMCVLALVLTVLQASPTLPGVDPLYASIFFDWAVRLIAHTLSIAISATSFLFHLPVGSGTTVSDVHHWVCYFTTLQYNPSDIVVWFK